MDLEGIGAVGAPVVALLTIPATVIAVRWQVRAALVQAQAMRDSSLDAARASHEQWRTSLRRDAYAAFLASVDQAVRVVDQYTSPDRPPLSSFRESLDRTESAMLDAVAAVELEGPPSVVEASAKCAEHVGMWFLQTRNRSHYDEGLRNLEERRAAEEQLADSSPRPATEALTALSAYQEWWLHGRRYDSDRMARGVALMTEFSDAVRDLEEVRSEAVTQIVARAALGALGSTGDRSDLDRLSERRIEFRRLRQVFLEAAHLALAPREYDGGGMV